MRTTPRRRFASPVLLTAALIGLLAASSTANASTYTTFTDAAAFAAAAPGLETYDFPTGDGSVQSRPYIDGPLGFSTTQHFTHPYLEDDGAYGAGKTYLALTGVPGVNAAMEPVVSTDLYAVAFDIGTYDGADSITLKMNFNDTVETFKTSGGAGTSTFIGIVSSDPIEQISFTAKDGTQIDILDFTTIAIAAPVPEPAPASLALAGLGLLGVVARRRRATASAAQA